MKIRKLNNKGMTLVEIIIVLVIIGFISSMVFNAINKNSKKAKINQTKVVINGLAQTIELYSTDCGSPPAKLEDLLTKPADCTNWGPESYVKALPKDAWNKDLAYEVQGNNYKISSGGQDGLPGTDDDISSDSK